MNKHRSYIHLRWYFKKAFIMNVAFTVILSVMILPTYAAPEAMKNDISIRKYLQDTLKYRGSILDESIRYSCVHVHLVNSKKYEYFVYLTGRTLCGSGGCKAFLLEPIGTSYRIINRFTLVRLPVRVLPSKTNGWHDLAMQVAGGGILTPYTAILRFNGHKYPSNPSMVPKLSPEKASAGKILPLSEKGELLY